MDPGGCNGQVVEWPGELCAFVWHVIFSFIFVYVSQSLRIEEF